MNKSTLINHLPTVGRIFTPAAMLVALTYEITKSQAEATGAWAIAILIGAAATAVGVEAVGILAGHVFEGFWRQHDWPRTTVALTLLLIYTAAGLFILRNNAALLPIPIVASVVYLVAGLAESLNVEQAQQAAATTIRQSFELKQEAADREMERRLKLKNAEANAAAKLARIQAKAAAQRSQPAPQVVVDLAAAPQSAKFYECSCGRVFDKPQSYSAHRRHCNVTAAVSQNGKANV